ncbi:hypothetical protein M758_5G123500, partial [Ceratodon purpureus]
PHLFVCQTSKQSAYNTSHIPPGHQCTTFTTPHHSNRPSSTTPISHAARTVRTTDYRPHTIPRTQPSSKQTPSGNALDVQGKGATLSQIHDISTIKSGQPVRYSGTS